MVATTSISMSKSGRKEHERRRSKRATAGDTRHVGLRAFLALSTALGITILAVVLWPGKPSPEVTDTATNRMPIPTPQEAGVVQEPTATPASAPAEAVPVKAEDSSTELVAQGTELLKAGDLKGAIALYQKALTNAPDDEDLHFNLGVAYARSGSLTNAEAHYREALRLLPDYPEAQNNLGNLLLNSGRMQEAEPHLAKAVESMPEYAVAQNSLGVLRQKQSRTNEALACFEAAARLDTNYWQARFNLGNAYLLHGESAKAAEEFKEVLRVNPAYPPAKRGLEKATLQPAPNQ
jgi:Flp pilus assembly protein TadD